MASAPFMGQFARIFNFDSLELGKQSCHQLTNKLHVTGQQTTLRWLNKTSNLKLYWGERICINSHKPNVIQPSTSSTETAS